MGHRQVRVLPGVSPPNGADGGSVSGGSGAFCWRDLYALLSYSTAF